MRSCLLQDTQTVWVRADLTGGLLGSASASPLRAGFVCPCPATAPLSPSLYFRSCREPDRSLRQHIPSACEPGLGERAAPPSPQPWGCLPDGRSGTCSQERVLTIPVSQIRVANGGEES